MMKHSFLICLLITCFSIAYPQSNFTLRIDPGNARGGNFGEIADSIKFIPLETTKESLFGSVGQLEITDSFFVIYDRRSFTILTFKRDGSFHARFGKTDKNETYLGFFSIIRDSNQIASINYADNELYIYDFNGNLIRVAPAPKNAESLFVFNEERVLYSLRRINLDGTKTKKPFDLAFSALNGKLIKYFKPFDQRYQTEEYNIMHSTINFAGAKNSCIFSLPFDYHVYQFNDTGLVDKYTFVFPMEYSLPPDFATDSAYKDQRIKYAYQTPSNAKKFNAINSVFRLGDQLIFSVVNSAMKVYDEHNFLYNLKSGNLISFHKVTGDSSTYFFPILNTTSDEVRGVYRNKIFASIPSVRILTISKEGEKKVNYPKKLDELIKTGTKMNNPVIVQFQLKENI